VSLRVGIMKCWGLRTVGIRRPRAVDFHAGGGDAGVAAGYRFHGGLPGPANAHAGAAIGMIVIHEFGLA